MPTEPITYEPDPHFIAHIKRMCHRFQQWPAWKKKMVGYKEATDEHT